MPRRVEGASGLGLDLLPRLRPRVLAVGGVHDLADFDARHTPHARRGVNTAQRALAYFLVLGRTHALLPRVKVGELRVPARPFLRRVGVTHLEEVALEGDGVAAGLPAERALLVLEAQARDVHRAGADAVVERVDGRAAVEGDGLDCDLVAYLKVGREAFVGAPRRADDVEQRPPALLVHERGLFVEVRIQHRAPLLHAGADVMLPRLDEETCDVAVCHSYLPRMIIGLPITVGLLLKKPPQRFCSAAIADLVASSHLPPAGLNQTWLSSATKKSGF